VRVEEIRRLIKLVEESEINELEVRRWWTRIRILKRAENHRGEDAHTHVVPNPLPVVAPSRTAASQEGAVTAVESNAAAPAQAAELAAEAGLVAIRSPMVGTFYRAPSPESPAYADVNQPVAVGQVVCIVEAMKLMNEIESEIAGTVVRILVRNAQPVEFNQPLFLVRPD